MTPGLFYEVKKKHLSNGGSFSINVLGLLAIAPLRFTAAGLPIGLQIAGAAFATVLTLASAYERETEWHRRHREVKPA
jgi:Asp-tRNA(Asn)/Glu-tRNA(Gln) amidotransferase A subunit family amidase